MSSRSPICAMCLSASSRARPRPTSLTRCYPGLGRPHRPRPPSRADARGAVATLTTHLLERGTDIRVIQALLGHEKLETTARYTRVATGIISKIESPLDGLSGPRRKRARHDTEKPPAL